MIFTDIPVVFHEKIDTSVHCDMVVVDQWNFLLDAVPGKRANLDTDDDIYF